MDARIAGLCILLLAVVPPVLSGAESVPNASFEEGQGAPASWRLPGGKGSWEFAGHTGARCVSVTGDGEDTNAWACTDLELERGAVFRLSFWVKGEGRGGCAIAGATSNNRDYPVTPQWQRQSFVFLTPHEAGDLRLRFGQWQWKGTIWFDDIELVRVEPVHQSFGELKLGAGEELAGDRYHFESSFADFASNYAPPLTENRAAFNTDRLVMGPDACVTYRFQLPGYCFESGDVQCEVGYHESGRCVVEGSADGNEWTALGEVARVGAGTFAIPAAVLPASVLWVRFRAVALDEKAAPVRPAAFQIHRLAVAARVSGPPVSAVGETHFVETLTASPLLDVRFLSLGDLIPKTGSEVELEVTPRGDVHDLLATSLVESANDRDSVARQVSLAAGGNVLRLPYHLRKTGPHSLSVTLRRVGVSEILFHGRGEFDVSLLHAADYGHGCDGDDNWDFWWCEAAYKVSRERPPAAGAHAPLYLEAARNEYESVQLVLHPKRAVQGVHVTCTALQGAGGARITSDQVAVSLVRYVHVTHPTDSVGSRGWWPDPLPPLQHPIDLEAGVNQPLWITVHVPKAVPAGDYHGSMDVRAEGCDASIPLRLHVWDFDLPDRSSVRSAFGFSPWIVKRYHRLETEEELRQVLDLHYQNFAAHRVSPYDPMALDPMRVDFGLEAGAQDGVKIDSTAFDKAAARYLDDFGFNTFRLDLAGMGGGTFHERVTGRIGPHEQGTPEYERLFGEYVRQVQEHLASRGWLDEAFLYWFDEPEPRDYAFVRDGMESVHRHAPGLRRMLTEQPEERLLGAVDIWCPILSAFDETACRARQKVGESIWWYVCTAPKGDYCTLFIDHPALDMRLWLWQTWKYGVEGVLVWSTTHWTSECAFPPPALQNPYEDPMAYVVGYGNPPGFVGHWGNGDGRFLYPPERCFLEGAGKVLEGPVSSLRWEMLREGIEDYEYFALLRERIEKARSRDGRPPPNLAEAEALLTVPEDICTSLTQFTRDPMPLYEHRRKLARAIEALGE
ncbi:MAG: glycoside hydrolase domain-containing protein [Planctomycetota bacterium]